MGYGRKIDRNQEVVERRKRGEAFVSIAKTMSLSNTRVRQIYLKETRQLCPFPYCACFEDSSKGYGTKCPKGFGRS